MAGLCSVSVWMSWAPPAEGLTKGKPPFPVASGEALCPPGYQVRLWGTAVLSPGPWGLGALAIPGDYQHGGRREVRRLRSQETPSSHLTSAIRTLVPLWAVSPGLSYR